MTPATLTNVGNWFRKSSFAAPIDQPRRTCLEATTRWTTANKSTVSHLRRRPATGRGERPRAKPSRPAISSWWRSSSTRTRTTPTASSCRRPSARNNRRRPQSLRSSLLRVILNSFNRSRRTFSTLRNWKSTFHNETLGSNTRKQFVKATESIFAYPKAIRRRFIEVILLMETFSD